MSAIDLFVSGSGNDRDGNRYEIASYEVQEDSTPVNAGDSFGGTGQLAFDVVDGTKAVELLFDRDVEIVDGFNGRFAGHVNSLSSEGGLASVTVGSLQSKLVGNTFVPPFRGRLDAAIRFYCSLAGIPSNQVFVDGSIATRVVSYPGWRGSIWTKLKELMAVEQVELSEVSSSIVIRPLRQRQMERSTDARINWAIDSQEPALWVEAYNYNSYYSPNDVVYGTEEAAITVQASETTIISRPVDASLMSISQPVLVPFNQKQTLTTSSYKVMDKDGEPIEPVLWNERGGQVVVEIGEDLSTVIIKVTGAQLPNGPFRLAYTDTNGDSAGSMIIVAEGVFYRKELLRVRTGASVDTATREVGITVDSPFISDAKKAYTVLYGLASEFTGPTMSVSSDLVVANRADDQGLNSSVTFGEFNAMYAGMTFAAFNTTWAGKTFGEISDYLLSLKDQQFENQAFGNVAGSRFRHRDAIYRVRSASIRPASIAARANPDTTIGDFNSIWSGKTFADFNSLWQNGTYSDFALRPLRTE